MSDTLPDRLCATPDSPFFNEELLARGIGIMFNGVEKTNVEEYCVSEGWVRIAVGTGRDRKGNPMTVKPSDPLEACMGLMANRGFRHLPVLDAGRVVGVVSVGDVVKDSIRRMGEQIGFLETYIKGHGG